MKQVTKRGLVQASIFIGVVLLAVIPLELSQSLKPRSAIVHQDPYQAEIGKLTHFIATVYHQPAGIARRIVEAAYVHAHASGLSPMLVLAVVAKESSFKLDAQSHYGAVGLMQVVPRFHKAEIAAISHPSGLKHLESNIAAGTRILRKYIKSSHGDVNQALHRYSGGARQYAQRVQRYANEFSTVASAA